MDKILIVNCGSSSLKYKLYNINLVPIASGLVERIGSEEAILNATLDHQTTTDQRAIADHGVAIEMMMQTLMEEQAINSLTEIVLIGHRVVHGGEDYQQAVIIDDDVEANIYALKSLAPLHNPANAIGIHYMREALPHATNVAVFDTAFHQTMAPLEYLYPVNYQYYQNFQLRRYGMHGTSHKYCMHEICTYYQQSDLRIINCHLGAGSSICAIEDQKSIATTMGLTPLAGVMMATRSGDIDPSVVEFLADKLDEDVHSVTSRLNKESGLLGVSGISGDMRDLHLASSEGNQQAQLAIDLYAHRCVEVISNYINKLNGVDVISFTAGIGENDAITRKNIINQLAFFGVKIDDVKNQNVNDSICEIQADDSSIKVVVVKADEELAIAQEAINLVK